MTEEAKPQSAPDHRLKIAYRVKKPEMRKAVEAANRCGLSVSQYARQALFLRIEKDQANG
ncbi:hypothetical protein [Castellaniella sp.]|uniref:hypothetical protein n=1 Tax=Castellaniella sp. TaxID=1955812 RepID=UPI002AFEF8DE|nr:hypothetical protein [Castellaniella sp.]